MRGGGRLLRAKERTQEADGRYAHNIHAPLTATQLRRRRHRVGTLLTRTAAVPCPRTRLENTLRMGLVYPHGYFFLPTDRGSTTGVLVVAVRVVVAVNVVERVMARMPSTTDSHTGRWTRIPGLAVCYHVMQQEQRNTRQVCRYSGKIGINAFDRRLYGRDVVKQARHAVVAICSPCN